MELLDSMLYNFFTISSEMIKIVENISYKNIRLGRDIFIVHFIGIKQQKNEECQIKDVMEYFNLTPSTATRHINSLVQSEVVIRKENQKKRSAKLLELSSPLGNEIFEMFETHQRNFNTQLADGFEQVEIVTIHRLLHWVTEHKETLFKF
jgi:DNA-binding MarR family transcriptional regulator